MSLSPVVGFVMATGLLVMTTGCHQGVGGPVVQCSPTMPSLNGAGESRLHCCVALHWATTLAT